MNPMALEGIRIIDLTHYVAGPFCTKLFADFGADVIKIENPGIGDGARRLGPFPNDMPDPEASGLFLYLNTNKRGITLNLKSKTGYEILKHLIESADILVENFRPGTMDKVGFGWKKVSEMNENLIMVSISEFGQTGPYRDYKASDLIQYGMSGFSYITGKPDREPLKGPPHQSQYQAGVYSFIAAISALIARDTLGLGQYIDVSIHESMCTTLRPMILRALISNNFNVRGRTQTTYPATFFQCKDGYVYIYAPTDPDWTNLVMALELDPEIAKDPRFSLGSSRFDHADQLNKLFMPKLMAMDKATLFRKLSDWGLVSGIAFTTEDLFQSDHLNERGFFVDMEHKTIGKLRYPGAPFKMQETPWQLRHPAPRLGEHNSEVYCGELGYTQDQLAQMERMEII